MKNFKKILKLLFIFFAILLVYLYVAKPALPIVDLILPDISNNEPLQEEIEVEPINITIAEYKYEIQPLYKYQIQGLVVSSYDSESWFDFAHRNDPAQSKDLCLIWGDNIKNNIYNEINFRSGEFTCYYEWFHDLVVPFNNNYIANNHLIPATQDIAESLKKVNLGDQVLLQGYLATYEVYKDNEFVGHRGTSVNREDSGNGACETIYLTDFEILEPANPIYHQAKKFFWYALLFIFIDLVIIFFLEVKRNIV